MMVFPAVTAAFAAVLALIFFALSIWVVAGRTKFGVVLGDGGRTALNQRIRTHANFAEYVPMILVLVALLEGSGESTVVIKWLLSLLVIARLMHPIGMVAREKSPQQFAFRAPGAILTWLVMIVAAVLLLLRMS